MVQGGMSIVKFLLFVFNFVFVVCGIALIVVGAIAQSTGKEYTVFLDSKFITMPTILIVLGCAIFFIAFLGCWGAMRQNYCMVTTFGILLFLIFIIEISAGIAAYVYRDDMNNFLHENMNKSFIQGQKDFIKIFDEMQSKFPCCGVDGPDDYKNVREVPSSCCGQKVETCTDPVKKGCFEVLEAKLKDKIAMVGGAGIGIGVIEILGMVFAWCLAVAIKKEYEGV